MVCATTKKRLTQSSLFFQRRCSLRDLVWIDAAVLIRANKRLCFW